MMISRRILDNQIGYSSLKPINGFTLIEVLVALVVLAGGLLGLAGLQASNLKSNQVAFNRTKATELAYDIVDRMRANALVADNYITTTAVPTPVSDCTSVTTACSKGDMAQNDLAEWNSAISAALPSGRGIITKAGNIYTVTLNWDENRDGDVDGNGGTVDGDLDGDGDTDDDPVFQMSFQI